KLKAMPPLECMAFFNPSFTAEINRIAVNLVRENLCVRTCAPVNLRPKRNARLFTVINVV
ncbi:MAG: hypothetical protein VYC98_16790, partial [Planctomycetota bacterium]|nr:hypothetical protein [Planctomycetota bacterium]